MDAAEKINSELKCLDRWLKSSKISINSDKTKCMLLSYNKTVNFPDISVGTSYVHIFIQSIHWPILATRRPMPAQYLAIFGLK